MEWGHRRGNIQDGVGPLLRTCSEGERQYVERRSSGVWSSPSLAVGLLVRVCGWGLGPARWRGSPSVDIGPWVGV